MAASFPTFIKHLWLDADDTARLIRPAVMQRLTEHVAASERQHSGEIRMCIEASLPLSYLWRVNKTRSLADVTRERAVMMFSKLGVWDTAANNGVLVYVLLAEHAIEIVADRGIAAHVHASQWARLVADMGVDFRRGHAEDGLRRAIDEITARLVEHFGVNGVDGVNAGGSNDPKVITGQTTGANPNELPDSPVLR